MEEYNKAQNNIINFEELGALTGAKYMPHTSFDKLPALPSTTATVTIATDSDDSYDAPAASASATLAATATISTTTVGPADSEATPAAAPAPADTAAAIPTPADGRGFNSNTGEATELERAATGSANLQMPAPKHMSADRLPKRDRPTSATPSATASATASPSVSTASAKQQRNLVGVVGAAINGLSNFRGFIRGSPAAPSPVVGAPSLVPNAGFALPKSVSDSPGE